MTEDGTKADLTRPPQLYFLSRVGYRIHCDSELWLGQGYFHSRKGAAGSALLLNQGTEVSHGLALAYPTPACPYLTKVAGEFCLSSVGIPT